LSYQLRGTINQKVQDKNKKQNKNKREENTADNGVFVEGSEFLKGGFHFMAFFRRLDNMVSR
jgi:hypothetical protein